MVDPTSVWGLNDNDQGSRRNTSNDSQTDKNKLNSSDDDQNSISQIETSAQSDDDNDDIPFFKHRGEN